MRTGVVAGLAALVAGVHATAFPPRLVPSKRASIERRTLEKHDFMLRGTALLSYADAPYLPPSASVVLTAHEHRPFLPLDEFDPILHAVECSQSSSTIVVTFADDEALTHATTAWGGLSSFVIITAHPGCNADGEHAAWAVEPGAISYAAGRTLALVATPVPLRDVVRSFAVRYDHAGASTWDARDALGLARRDEHALDKTFNFGFNPDIPARMPLFPPNATLDDGVSAAVLSQLTDAEVALTCIDCTMRSNVTIGMDFAVDIANASCVVDADTPCFTFSSAAMNFTVEEFEQGAALEVFIGKELNAGTNYKILWIPVAPALNIPSLIDLGPAIGLEIAFELDLQGSINFTYGAKGKIPNGAFASVSLVNSMGDFDPKFEATGWDGAGVDQVPFRMNSGELNMTMSVAFAPFAEIAFTVLDVGAALRLIQNVPKASTSASVRETVNRECQPLGAGDFESFQTAFALGAGLELSMEAQLVLEKGAFVGHSIPDKWDVSLYNHALPFEPALGVNTSACFVLSSSGLVVTGDDGVVTTLGGVPAPTGTLVAAAQAVPTWDVQGIEAYYAAHSQLPTNVNYAQMVHATTVPDNIKSAVSQTAAAQASETAKKGNGAGRVGGCASIMLGLVGLVVFVLI